MLLFMSRISVGTLVRRSLMDEKVCLGFGVVFGVSGLDMEILGYIRILFILLSIYRIYI